MVPCLNRPRRGSRGCSRFQALLADVSHQIGPARELAPVLRTVLDAMRSLVDFRGGSICLVDDRGVFVAAADEDITPGDGRGPGTGRHRVWPVAPWRPAR